jgi:hypothetical protein
MTDPVVALPGGVDEVTIGDVVAAALRHAGDDAVIPLGRRAVPMGGMGCPRCHAVSGAPLRLLPAAAGTCGCGGPRAPLATRSQIGVRELAAAAALSLRAFGSAPGEELVAVGSAGVVRLRTSFDWKELDG